MYPTFLITKLSKHELVQSILSKYGQLSCIDSRSSEKVTELRNFLPETKTKPSNGQISMFVFFCKHWHLLAAPLTVIPAEKSVGLLDC
jgi:hypothetical protein